MRQMAAVNWENRVPERGQDLPGGERAAAARLCTSGVPQVQCQRLYDDPISPPVGGLAAPTEEWGSRVPTGKDSCNNMSTSKRHSNRIEFRSLREPILTIDCGNV